jgi:penicillin amidase
MIIRKSLDDALNVLSATLGGEMKEWRWGRVHTLTLQHPFGSIDVLKPIFNIGPTPVGGSGTTVNNGEYRLSQPYAMTLGPSMRHIVDFADINRALSVIPSGQSGQPLHPQYDDQFTLWKNGEYHTVSMDEKEIALKSKNILYLIPSK